MDKTLGESRAGARPQRWGDFAIFLASVSGTQGKVDDVSADPRLLPPSPPELRSAGQRQHQPHQLRLPRETVPGEHALHGRAAAETMVDAASERQVGVLAASHIKAVGILEDVVQGTGNGTGITLHKAVRGP